MNKLIGIIILCFASFTAYAQCASCIDYPYYGITNYAPYYMNSVNNLVYGANEARWEKRGQLLEVEMNINVEVFTAGLNSFDFSLPTAVLPTAILIGNGIDEASRPVSVTITRSAAGEDIAHASWYAYELGPRTMTIRLSYRWHY